MLMVKVIRLPLIARHIFSNSCCQFTPPVWTSQVGAKRFSQQKKAEKMPAVEIYVGPLAKQIRRLKFFSLMTSVSGLMAQPIIFEKAGEVNASFGAVAFIIGFMGFFTFATPILINVFTKKYVISLEYHLGDDSYTAKVYSLFLRVNKITFKTSDVKIPATGGFMSTFLAKGRPLFIDARYFSDLSHYKKIMGYDKPLNFEFEEEEDSKTKT